MAVTVLFTDTAVAGSETFTAQIDYDSSSLDIGLTCSGPGDASLSLSVQGVVASLGSVDLTPYVSDPSAPTRFPILTSVPAAVIPTQLTVGQTPPYNIALDWSS